MPECRHCEAAKIEPTLSALHLLYETLIGQSFIDGILEDLVKPIHCVIPHISLVETENELIDVTMHMLLAPMMINAVVAPLQYRPNAFNTVRMNTPVDVLPDLVLDKSVFVGAFQSCI